MFIPFPRPRVVISIPSGVTEVEKRAVRDAALEAGAREAYLIEEPMAAAIGAGLPVTEAQGSMIVDIGGGTTEVAVFALKGIVVSKSLRIAGDELDDDIVQYARQKYNLAISERTAERVKINIGSAYPLPEERTMAMRGRNLITGLPEEIEISSIEIREALSRSTNIIVDLVRDTLDETPPELVSDLMETGICLAGGGGLLKGIAERIAEETHPSLGLTRPADVRRPRRGWCWRTRSPPPHPFQRRPASSGRLGFVMPCCAWRGQRPATAESQRSATAKGPGSFFPDYRLPS